MLRRCWNGGAKGVWLFLEVAITCSIMKNFFARVISPTCTGALSLLIDWFDLNVSFRLAFCIGGNTCRLLDKQCTTLVPCIHWEDVLDYHAIAGLFFCLIYSLLAYFARLRLSEPRSYFPQNSTCLSCRPHTRLFSCSISLIFGVECSSNGWNIHRNVEGYIL